MKKDWQSKKIHENAWGIHIDRWYLTAPSGNVYLFFRHRGGTFYFYQKFEEPKSAIALGGTYNEAIQKIYKMEEKTKKCTKYSAYIKRLSDKNKTKKEYQFLYSSEGRNYSYSW